MRTATLIFTASALACVATTSIAGGHALSCPVDAAAVRILSNDFPALHAVNDRAVTCTDDPASVVLNQTSEHKSIQVAALTANPAKYSVAVVANGTLVPLLNEGVIRPLDDLIAKYSDRIPSNQVISVNGQAWAIAFMANSQHLYYREDILAQAGLEPPSTYEEVLAAAQAIEDQGIMEDPLSLNTGVGWHLAQEFVNMYLGHGGEFFEPGSARPAINNEKGVAALEMIKSLTEYSNPDFLTFDGNTTNALWSSGDLALAVHWGSRAGQFTGDQTPAEIGAVTKLTGMPTVAGGNIPASTLWWDGFTIAQNISDDEAEAAFVAMIDAIQPAILEEHSDRAVWLIPGYEPTPTAIGVAETAQGGAKPYPMLPYMGVLHGILGAEMSDFLQGSESAAEALADIEESYIAAAREQGFLN